MISKHKIKYKNGTVKTNVRIVEGYRPTPGAPPKQRQIKNLGYAEDYEDQEAFWKMVAEEERKFKESKENLNICLDTGKTLVTIQSPENLYRCTKEKFRHPTERTPIKK